eukprot:3935909-Rhodomonas_salina.2
MVSRLSVRSRALSGDKVRSRSFSRVPADDLAMRMSLHTVVRFSLCLMLCISPMTSSNLPANSRALMQSPGSLLFMQSITATGAPVSEYETSALI